MNHFKQLEYKSDKRERARRMYLDWVNNFLSVSRFAEHYGIGTLAAKLIIDIGRKEHNLIAKMNEIASRKC